MGDDYMTIAALSVSMAQNQVNQNLGVSVLKEAMNAEAVATEDLLEEIAVNLDIDIQA